MRLGPHNERASWGRWALSEGNFKGPTLIKVKSLKSDFDQRDQPATSRPPFSTTADPDESDVNCGPLLRFGLSAGAGSRGDNSPVTDLIQEQVGALGPSVREILKVRL